MANRDSLEVRAQPNNVTSSGYPLQLCIGHLDMGYREPCYDQSSASRAQVSSFAHGDEGFLAHATTGPRLRTCSTMASRIT